MPVDAGCATGARRLDGSPDFVCRNEHKENSMRIDAKSVASGILFVLMGLAYFWMAWSKLPIGSAMDMGPGYFPIVLSGGLVVFGSWIALLGIRSSPDSEFGVVPWRAIIMLTLATLVFAAFFDDLGLFPGIFVLTLLASLASSENTLIGGVLLSLFMAVFCTAVFGYGIGLPIPVVGPLFNF